MKHQPEIHSRQKYFASLVNMDKQSRDRSRARKRKSRKRGRK